MTHFSEKFVKSVCEGRACIRPFVVLAVLLGFAVACADARDAELDAELLNSLPNEKRVEELLKQGADPNVGMKRAASSSSLKVIRLLIAHGANVHAKDSAGNSVLREAASRRKPTAVRILLEAGAKPDDRALWQAAWIGRIETVKVLLAAGANPDGGLDGAAAGGKLDIVKLLLDKGAKVNARFEGPQGFTALQTAAQYRHSEVVQLLIVAGAKPDARTSNGDTPLHLAVSTGRGNLKTVRLLVRAGAKVNVPNNEGTTHIGLAEKSGATDAQDWLLAINGGKEPRGADAAARPLRLSKEPVRDLLAALVSDRKEDRLAALGELLFRGEKVMPEAIKVLESDGALEPYRSLLFLMGSEAELALPALASRLEKKEEVYLAMTLMDSINPKAFDGLSQEAKANAAKALGEVVADPNSGDLGVSCAGQLWRTEKHATRVFLQLLRQESPTVRIRVGNALATVRLSDKRVEDELDKLTGADQPRAVQAAAVAGLTGFREKAAVLAMLKKGPPPRQGVHELDAHREQLDWYHNAKQAARKLGRFGPDVIDDLMPFLSPLKLPARIPAVTALASIGPPAVPRLVDMLASADRSVAVSASVALNQMGSSSVPELTRAVDTGNEQAIDLALGALWWIGSSAKPALPKLLEVVGDGRRSETSRVAAARAALKIDAATCRKSEAVLSAIPLLIRVLEKENFELQIRAAEALGATGPAARDALPALRKIAKTPPPRTDVSNALQMTTKEAIAKIEATPDPEAEDDP